MEALRIVLLGKTGSGKSSAGNTLLGNKPFHTAPSSQGVTHACSMSISTVDRQKIHVVDTPGWTDSLTDAETTQEIVKCIDISDPGPHVLLLAVPIGRFTKEEIDTAKQILEAFGEDANNYMVVLFTRGDDLGEKTIEGYLKGVHPDLKNVIEICGGRYHVFNNKDKENHGQVSTLLETIKDMVERNKGRYYTKAMYEKTAEKMKGEQEKQKFHLRMVKEVCMEKTGDSDVKSNDGTISTEREEQQHSVNMKGRDSDRAKEKECKLNLQEEERESETTAKNQDKKSDSKNDTNEEDMREGRKSKELCEMVMKLQMTVADLQKKIHDVQITNLTATGKLQNETQQLNMKLKEQKTEIENVKKVLQQLK